MLNTISFYANVVQRTKVTVRRFYVYISLYKLYQLANSPKLKYIDKNQTDEIWNAQTVMKRCWWATKMA